MQYTHQSIACRVGSVQHRELVLDLESFLCLAVFEVDGVCGDLYTKGRLLTSRLEFSFPPPQSLMTIRMMPSAGVLLFLSNDLLYVQMMTA